MFLLKPIFFPAAISTLPALAQFSSLSTNTDGTTLFFTTPLGQTGLGQANQGKVFLADSAGIRPWLIRSRVCDPVRFAWVRGWQVWGVAAGEVGARLPGQARNAQHAIEVGVAAEDGQIVLACERGDPDVV